MPPLAGLKVIEFAGLAPGPFAGMFFADAGADVLRIDRAVEGAHGESTDTDKKPPPTDDLLTRRKASIAVNLKAPAGVALVRALAATADVLIDPFRPGVLERLGLGPDDLRRHNPRLVYARLSGFRRDGRYHRMAGHDINYLAVSGALALLGRAGQPPTPPANILADFAGGGLMLVVGVLLALRQRDLPGGAGHGHGHGQVVEANMVDGVSYLATFSRLHLKTPGGDHARGHNVLDSGCPYYDTYETSDGGFMAVGALEPQFFAQLVERLGLADQGQTWTEARRRNRAQWPALRSALAHAFRSRTRAHWEAVFDGADACCTPVLEYGELEAGSGGDGTTTTTTTTTTTREGDQRPAVGLCASPLLGVDLANGDSGYEAKGLRPGEGGEDVLQRWCGWRRGAELDVVDGGLVLRDKARL